MLKYRVSVLIEHWHQAAGNETEEDAFREKIIPPLFKIIADFQRMSCLFFVLHS